MVSAVREIHCFIFYILFLVKDNDEDNNNNNNDIEVDKEEWENLQSDISSLNKTISDMLMTSSGGAYTNDGRGRSIADSNGTTTKHQFAEMIF